MTEEIGQAKEHLSHMHSDCMRLGNAIIKTITPIYQMIELKPLKGLFSIERLVEDLNKHWDELKQLVGYSE